MAKKPYRSIAYQMTKGEKIAGWIWLPFYLMLLSCLLSYGAKLLGIDLNAITMNVAYFAVNLLFVLIAFRRFLLQRFFGSSFWDFLQALILGGVLYYAGTWLVNFLITAFAGEFTIFNNETVGALVGQNRYVMLVISVILAPIIEETLIRGVVFGSFYGASPVLAYIVSCFVFAFMHNWAYFETQPPAAVLLSCLPYIPAGIALGWVYKKSGSIWCAVTLHALINANSFGLLHLR